MPSSIRFRVWSRTQKGALVIFMLRWVAETMEIRMHVSADTCTKHIHTDMKHPFREIKRMMIITTIAMQVYKKYCKLQRMTALIIITAMAIYPPFQSPRIAPFQRIFPFLSSPCSRPRERGGEGPGRSHFSRAPPAGGVRGEREPPPCYSHLVA